MRNSGVAIMGSAAAEGEERALTAVKEALSSPLLNDNDISGAQYVLLNITYGDKEVLMDEITTITDFIQDEAGSTADVIWGHGYDPSLGDKLSVTLIATGFSSNPITGFEKAPERKVRTLEEEPKNEVKAPLESPTQMNTFNGATEIKAPLDEPFIKSEVKAEEVSNTPVAETPVYEAPKVETPAAEISFDWEVKTTTSSTTTEVTSTAKEEVVRHMLDDESSSDLSNVQAKSVLSPEEQQRKTQERMSKIHEYTSKLKKAEGISEFENEPAFVRRNIQLNMSKPSSEENFSRFGLTEDEDRTVLRNNNFLHDNVD
jgi:cell division protein FtsZ